MEDTQEYDEFDDEFDDEELPDGELDVVLGVCDNCPGTAPEPGTMGAITPVCACALGQGAGPDECTCGPINDEEEAA